MTIGSFGSRECVSTLNYPRCIYYCYQYVRRSARALKRCEISATPQLTNRIDHPAAVVDTTNVIHALNTAAYHNSG